MTFLQDASYLIGFNEPENHDKIKAADGARAWANMEKLADEYNLALVAPCVGNYNHSSDQKWLKEWREECITLYGRPCRHDHVCTHAYFSGKDAARELEYMLGQMYHDFKQPIWLNEFAYGLAGHTADEQLAFMKDVLPVVHSSPYVFRYSWYVSRHMAGGWNSKRGSSLLLPNSSTLSPLGEFYNAFPNISISV